MNLQKHKPWRSESYKKWVRSLACAWTGRTGDTVQAHHLINCGMGGAMGSKQSDLFVIPLDAEAHAKLHHDPKGFQLDQKAACLKTIEKAINDGVLVMGMPEQDEDYKKPFISWRDGLGANG